MSKFLVIAAQVVGAAVAIASAIPTGGTSLLAYGLGVSATTAATIAALTTVGVGLLSTLSAKGPGSGVPSSWRADTS